MASKWQEPPADFPARVLLATDAASEGISLQRHCHLLAHAEIPWNPNRLEQRNGRIDRHGQLAPEVLVHHCVSAGWETASRGSLEGDLDFLARVVVKVQQIREDLGSAGPVIAAQIEEAMLGRRKTLDDTRFSGIAASRALLEQERRMRERLAALRDDLAESRTTLHLQPDRVHRVVATALQLARQPALQPGAEPGTYRVPGLTGSWTRATIGLEHPARPEERRRITFDHELVRNRTDLVLAHLGHPLVRMALALLRAEVWGTGHHLNRVTVRYAQASLQTPVAVAHGRLVITGQSGHRLHEQLIFAGLRLDGERSERLGVQETEAALTLARDTAVPATLADRLIPRLQASAEPLRAALQARAGDRARQLAATLAARARDEQAHVEATLRGPVMSSLTTWVTRRAPATRPGTAGGDAATQYGHRARPGLANRAHRRGASGGEADGAACDRCFRLNRGGEDAWHRRIFRDDTERLPLALGASLVAQ